MNQTKSMIKKGQNKNIKTLKNPFHKPKAKVPQTAQHTIPYIEMYRDGMCRVTENYYTKTIQFYDINYQLAQNEDQKTIFENYCDFLNYFDPSINVQLSFINQQANLEEYSKTIAIPNREDNFNSIRKEYMEMLHSQLSKGNNGLIKTKYITFGIEATSLKLAKARLERIETDIINNFKTLGVATRSMSGVERLEILHHTFNMDTKEPFRFHYDLLPETGLTTKDFIAPTSFDFRSDKTFRMGKTMGCISYLQITTPELADKMLAEFLDIEENLIINIHIKSIDQREAIKNLKKTLSDIQKMKIEEQKKAVRNGYDMDISATLIAV